MPTRRLTVRAPLRFDSVRAELEVPVDFPAEVLAEASAAAAGPVRPAEDATDIPFVTVDPVGSRDLDQALHVAARPAGGFRVSYAIADVAAFVRPGGAVDAEARRRTQTLYSPDLRTPLHPPVLGEGAASLLPDQVRPAVLWRIDLDPAGEVTAVDVRRARVRSRAQLDYPGLQAAVDAGSPPEPVAALAAVGELRLALAAARHATELDVPEQEVVPAGSGWTVEFRRQLPVERWNAQISLLTGACAARLMLDGGIGLLRTLPAPRPADVAALRRLAPALGVSWPDGAEPGDVISALDGATPGQAAFLEHAAVLLRGAAYTPFDGTPPADPLHHAVGMPYAHVTAPIRRLVDRFGSEVCLALAAGTPVPDWVRAALPELPALMTGGGRLAGSLERATVDATEAWLLTGQEGRDFPAVVVDAGKDKGTIVLAEPAVRATCAGADLPVGETITARLEVADQDKRLVRFTRAPVA